MTGPITDRVVQGLWASKAPVGNTAFLFKSYTPALALGVAKWLANKGKLVVVVDFNTSAPPGADLPSTVLWTYCPTLEEGLYLADTAVAGDVRHILFVRPETACPKLMLEKGLAATKPQAVKKAWKEYMKRVRFSNPTQYFLFEPRYLPGTQRESICKQADRLPFGRSCERVFYVETKRKKLVFSAGRHPTFRPAKSESWSPN